MPPALLIPTKMERVLYELGRIYPERERKKERDKKIFALDVHFPEISIVASIYI